MAKYISKFSGRQVDEAVEIVRKQQELGTDKILDSTADKPVDLNTMLFEEGKYTIYYFTGADEGSTSGKPIEVEVFKYKDGAPGQRYEKNGTTVERKYDTETSTWGDWVPVTDFSTVTGDEVLQVSKDTIVYREVKDASEVVLVS